MTSKSVTANDTARRRICQDQDVFRECKERVSCAEVATFCGYHPNRAGFICCPFHAERTASLKLYKSSWFCFGCKSGGDAVDFVAKLYNIPAMAAVKKLDADFSLGLNLDVPHVPTKAEVEAAREQQEVRDTAEKFEEWRISTVKRLNQCLYIANYALSRKSPDTWTPAEICAVKNHATIEHLADELDGDDRTEECNRAQLNIYRIKGEVSELCNAIL